MVDVANIWIWLGFTLFVIFALAIDTFFLNKKIARPHQSMRAALTWTFVWVSCALIFNALLWLYLYATTDVLIANEKAVSFFTGYIIEKSLSIDNLFAFYLVFHQFNIPQEYQQRVFSYGIWSAIVLRLLLILIGSWLVTEFHWVLYLMGAFLLLTGIKMFFSRDDKKELRVSSLFRWLQKHIRITDELHAQRFFIKKKHLIYATPLFIALIFIELSDLIFALDSIPAIFAITTDPFIVWSCNIFAILGLRALYFLLARMVQRFRLLKYGIALILVFIGSKMLIEPWIHLSVILSLSVILMILLLFSGLSMLTVPGTKK